MESNDHNKKNPNPSEKDQRQNKQPAPGGNKDDANREWEEAQKHQDEFATRPGVDMDDMEQHDEAGNPKDIK